MSCRDLCQSISSSEHGCSRYDIFGQLAHQFHFERCPSGGLLLALLAALVLCCWVRPALRERGTDHLASSIAAGESANSKADSVTYKVRLTAKEVVPPVATIRKSWAPTMQIQKQVDQ